MNVWPFPVRNAGGEAGGVRGAAEDAAGRAGAVHQEGGLPGQHRFPPPSPTVSRPAPHRVYPLSAGQRVWQHRRHPEQGAGVAGDGGGGGERPGPRPGGTGGEGGHGAADQPHGGGARG